MKCSPKLDDHQPFPKTGQLAGRLNLQLDTLRQQIPGSQATVYCFIIATIENRKGTFVQTGSAPNFQGDLVTLCTCKHYMRTFLDTEAWKGKWVAGFTGSKAGNGRNYLMYLMQVAQTFESHYDFWFSETILSRTKRAKAAHLDRFGDIYKPQSEATNPFDPRDYVAPRNDHIHAASYWYEDIDYVGLNGRPAVLLAGDPEQSYLWDRPMIFSPLRLYRGQKKCRLDELLSQLKVGETE